VEMQDLLGSGGSGIGPGLENVAEINYVLVNAPHRTSARGKILTTKPHARLWNSLQGHAHSSRSEKPEEP